MSFTVQVFIFSLIIFVLTLFLSKQCLRTPKSHKNLPPSPPKLPLIGNLHQLSSSPHRALHSMAQTYGPLMLIHLGTVPVIVASSVNGAQEILKTHDLIFANRPNMLIAGRIFYNSRDIAFSKYGEYWRQMKSIAVLHLLSNKRVQSYRHVREEEMGLVMEKLLKSNGSAVNLSELLYSLTNNVNSRVALGRKYEGRNFKHMIKRFSKLLGSFSVANYIPSLKWVDHLRGLVRKADEVATQFDEFIEGVIEEHVNKKLIDVEGRDVVDILLEIQKENSIGFPLKKDMIKAIILDLFTAGTDTTFTTLEWAICELLRHPKIMNKLQEETLKIGQGRPLITEDDLEKMPYLRGVIKEALRIHTPLPLLTPRESTQDVKVLGYDIPSGTQVLINAWAIARDPSIWEASEEFRPERFLNNSIDYKGFHFEFLPFGAGRRGCPGIQFGMIINEFVLANLMYKFDLALIGKESLDMSESYGISVHLKSPILVSATPCS